jgi:nucleotide-binding universal stress UspA family protein
VHAGTDDAGEQMLNIRIVEMALLLARLTNGTATLLQAWTPFAESLVRRHMSGDAATTYVEDVRRRTEAELARLAAPFAEALRPPQIVMRRGEPDEEIPQFVVSEGVHVLVMGTMARSGIPGLVIGNTVERVLRRVACSVVAVKPDGFVSPVSV